MSTQVTTDSATYAAQIIKQAVNSWTAQQAIITKFFNQYPEAVYEENVAPGRNRGIYLLGHLTSSNDGILPLLGISERQFPAYEEWFTKNPDGAFETIPTLAELKESWAKVNEVLAAHFSTMTVEDWLSKHTRISEEDFAKEPLRNKLSILLSRTNHMAYHVGQLVFLNQKVTA